MNQKFNTMFVCTLMWLWLAACGTAPTPASPAAEATQPPGQLVKLKVAVAPFISNGHLYIAQAEGFFAEQGLEVEFVRFEKTSDTFPALVNGDVDAVAGYLNVALFNAIAQTSDVKIVADKGYFEPTGCTFSAIVARQGLNLTTVADMKGRPISMNKQSMEGYYLSKILQANNLTLADLDIKSNLPYPTEVDTLKSGTVDFVAAAEPWVTRMQELAGGTVWKTAQEVVPNAQFSVLSFGSNLLVKNPELGQKFMVAYLKGVQQYSEGKTDRNIDILSKGLKTEPEFLQKSCWPSFRANGQLEVKSTSEFQAWGVAEGYIKEIVPAEKFWEPKFVQFAANQLGIK